MLQARSERFAWAALAVAALLPRVLAAAVRPPWHDEYFTAWAARLPVGGLITALRVDSGPPLPYLLVKLFTITGLEPLAAARAISVAAGTLAVLVAALAARRTFGAAAGWWTGALIALHPLAIAWSCEGRAYALLLLSAAWGWERLEKLARTGSGAVGLAAAVALACWSHGLGLLLGLVFAAAAITLRPEARRRAEAAVAAGLATHLLWLPIALAQPPASLAWMTTAWQSLTAPARLAAPVRLLSPLGAFGSALDLPSPPPAIEAVTGVALLAIVVVGLGAGRAALRPLLGFALPPLALGALSALGVPAFYPGRGEALALVPLLALAGSGASRLRTARAACAVLVAGAAAMSGAALAEWTRRPASGEERLASALRDRMPLGGRVVIGGFWRLGIAYHLGHEASRFTLLNYPASAAAHPGWYDPGSDRPAPGEAEALAELLRSHAPRTAVVVVPGLRTEGDLERLAGALGLVQGLEVPGARLLLPARSPTGDRPRAHPVAVGSAPFAGAAPREAHRCS